MAREGEEEEWLMKKEEEKGGGERRIGKTRGWVKTKKWRRI